MIFIQECTSRTLAHFCNDDRYTSIIDKVIVHYNTSE